MKIKLAALLAFIMIGLAGCSAADNSNAPKNTNATNANTANKTASTETSKSEDMVAANANPTAETGGTKEGCKCSAAGMKCNMKAGEKGCCGGKDGACSTMADGKASCCASKGKAGEACCSTAGKMAENMDGKGKMDNMPAGDAEKKSEAAPAKKS